ncbi:MAG: aminotransferase class V-fold PLP-dependent enzyme [Reyranella sp.]|uniref:aminotransferase class V-fold PLP-dependent enzyme n=1 Tax=Reyranella sp. TaxID=1929291 RepID=UPI0011FE8DCF|nr:aminotransferase class V-fold PLP-dependent enzyme [Reyranella sp.]TAJ88990.1 MAG: aminotransferase class V-fold PLP-dependent enzyme [Reyranella sp.]TBR30349.1 MAG: aminotransferase class V-fold PLP-dependent enzyme [Reyranella sp.]
MTDASPYDLLGVRRRINAAGALTRLGGAVMEPEVVAAMAAASRASVDIGELQDAASGRIAAATGAEAGLVTTGAAAALTLAAAASIARWDIAKMAALPHAGDFPHDILILRTHRTGYAHALAASGARLIDIGHNDRGTGAGVRGLEAWEIEAALSPAVVAMAFSVNASSIVDLPTAIATCRANGIPLIVDAAAQLPPKENLRRFIDMGADLVAFSGGKALGGPQASGILAGRRDLVASALLQQLDMDVAPDTWTPPRLVDRANLRGVPHHGIGRGFKAGKEEIVGLLAALERFVEADDATANAALQVRLEVIATALNGFDVKLVPAAQTGRVPVLEIAVPDALAVSAKLQKGDPPVHLSERHAARGVLTLDPQVLLPEHDAPLAAALRAVLHSTAA